MRPVHPGEVLRDELDELGLSANALSKALGVPVNRVTMILNSQRGVSADTTLRLSRYFGTTPQLWMNLQKIRELRQAETAAGREIAERVIIDLLIAMGYGGGDAAKGRVTGHSGDGGIDGTIREDALGLDEIYVQAKKYADGNTVGVDALRNFAGAIDTAGTTKGVFVTTASFTKAAKDYVARSPKRIVLIDGEELARLMVQHGVGVRTRVHHEIKRIDEDYFDQEAL